jgi:hypothetical protein
MVGARLHVIVLGFAASAGCAAPGATLHSNHYTVYAAPEWQVVEASGDPAIPTLLRVPPAEGRTGPTVEIRIYSWLTRQPIAQPSGEAFERLGAAGALGVARERDDEPCVGSASEVVVFRQPAHLTHMNNAANQRLALAAGHTAGSLVAIVGVVAATPSPCVDTLALDSAVKRVAGALAADRDATRVPAPPVDVWGPGRGPLLQLPAADPSAP